MKCRFCWVSIFKVLVKMKSGLLIRWHWAFTTFPLCAQWDSQNHMKRAYMSSRMRIILPTDLPNFFLPRLLRYWKQGKGSSVKTRPQSPRLTACLVCSVYQNSNPVHHGRGEPDCSWINNENYSNAQGVSRDQKVSVKHKWIGFMLFFWVLFL